MNTQIYLVYYLLDIFTHKLFGDFKIYIYKNKHNYYDTIKYFFIPNLIRFKFKEVLLLW